MSLLTQLRHSTCRTSTILPLIRLRNSAISSSSNRMASGGKVAVVLSGCGVYDGTEVHEAAACLAALTRAGLEPVIHAPDIPQAHVINHTTGSEMDPARRVIIESGRIARGPVKPLTEVSHANVKAIVFPGGFGAAKNLSDFGFKGESMTVHEDVERILREFHAAGKPIALCCIAPILAAKVFGGDGVKLTMGKKGDKKLWPYGDALDAAKSFGAEVVEMDVGQVCVDEKNRIITTPAFMYAGMFHEIQDGVGNMIKELASMINKVNP